MWVIRSGGPNHNIKARSGRQIIACAKGVIDATNQVIDIGPLAVHPDYQVITSNWESNMFLPFYYNTSLLPKHISSFFYYRVKVLGPKC